MSDATTRQWQCPACGGWGHAFDGRLTVGPGELTDYRPPTPCHLCRGKRFVYVTPIPDDVTPAPPGGEAT